MCLITAISVAFFLPKTIKSVFRKKSNNVAYPPITLLAGARTRFGATAGSRSWSEVKI